MLMATVICNDHGHGQAQSHANGKGDDTTITVKNPVGKQMASIATTGLTI